MVAVPVRVRFWSGEITHILGCLLVASSPVENKDIFQVAAGLRNQRWDLFSGAKVADWVVEIYASLSGVVPVDSISVTAIAHLIVT